MLDDATRIGQFNHLRADEVVALTSDYREALWWKS